jgi:molybdopterin-guanine dinucleotide biosynthesis adapter protein
MKALGIIGYHHTGKTTLAVALIRHLTNKGYKVASIKDIHNEAYRADKEGSNSWKHAEAGAGQVFARGQKDAALILNPAPDLPQIISLLRADWLIIEGMKHAAVPKIICAETTDQIDELWDETVIAISGPIAENIKSYKDLPVVCLERQSEGLFALVEQKVFDILPQSEPDCCSACSKTCSQMAADIVQGRAQRTDCIQDTANSLTLKIGSDTIQIVPFVQNILRDNILAFVQNLKDIPALGDININIRR